MLQVVDVELTPNPHALKFVISDRLLRFETRQFNNKEEAVNDPLAKNIFDLPGIVSVFYMDKFITIEKTQDTDWGKIQRPLVNMLARFEKSSIPAEQEPEGMDADSSEMLKRINDILNQKVKPALAHDGGGLEVLGFEGYTLRVRYQGACGSCPSAISGTLNAIESLLKKDISPALQVIAG